MGSTHRCSVKRIAARFQGVESEIPLGEKEVEIQDPHPQTGISTHDYQAEGDL
jgi:hypothetical protein